MIRPSADIPRSAFPADQRQPIQSTAGAEELDHVARIEQASMAAGPASHPQQRLVPHQIADGLNIHCPHSASMQAIRLKS